MRLGCHRAEESWRIERQPSEAVADNSALAETGIDVLGASRFVVGYDLGAMLAVPMPELPEVFPARGRMKRYPKGCCSSSQVEGLTEALRRLDPVEWNGKFKEWFALMTGARFVGIARDEFIAWSTGDPDYAEDGDEIAALWEATRPVHGGAFWKALSEAGIKVRTGPVKTHTFGVPVHSHSSHFQPTIDVRLRTKSLLGWLDRNATEPGLFSVAAAFAEIVAEGKLKIKVAYQLLIGAAGSNGLRQSLGRDGVKLTIDRAFDHINGKLVEAE
jgi:hypothetical protein